MKTAGFRFIKKFRQCEAFASNILPRGFARGKVARKKFFYYLKPISFSGFFLAANLLISAAAYPQSLKQIMDKIVTDTMADKQIPGAIIGVWSPAVGVWVKAFGKSDLGIGKNMDDKKRMRIGSVTQTFLASVLLSLADEKKINLDEKLIKYLPYFPNAESITIRQLADNTSGIFNYSEDPEFMAEVLKNPLKEYQPMELVNIALKNKPYFAPGQGWHLSDTNFVLLGMIIEKITSEKIEDLIKFKIINRIGLKNTSFAVDPFMEGDSSRGYIDENDHSTLPKDITLLDPSVAWASGAMVSDVQDLSLWAKALYRASFLGEQMRASRFNWMATGEPYLQYGLGVSKFGDFIGYSGGIPGYACTVYYLPDKDTTIIVMLNKFPDYGAAVSIFKALAKAVVADNVPW